MTTIIEEGGFAEFAANHANKPQLLVFSASWCAPCKAMAPALEDIADLYAGQIAIGRIDIETAPDLASAYGVRGVPTLVGLDGEGEVARLVGGHNKTRLAMLADWLLDRAGRGAEQA